MLCVPPSQTISLDPASLSSTPWPTKLAIIGEEGTCLLAGCTQLSRWDPAEEGGLQEEGEAGGALPLDCASFAPFWSTRLHTHTGTPSFVACVGEGLDQRQPNNARPLQQQASLCKLL